MGLDVDLYRYEDFGLSIRKQEEYEKRSSAIWDGVLHGRKYDELTEAEKDDARRRCDEARAEMALDSFEPERVLLKPKTKLPKDHIFEVGYFRSSYNDSGLNEVLESMGVPDLHEIFAVERGQYHVKPDWRASLDRVNDAIKKFKSSRCGFLASELSIFGLSESVVDCATAVKLVKEKMLKDKGSFTCRDGHFWLDDPIKAKAIIPGKNHLGAPAIYMVYAVGKEHYDWYLKALMVVRETIQYVLEQKDSEKYVLHWSG